MPTAARPGVEPARRPHDWWFLWSYLRREPGRLGLLAVTLLGGTACALVGPFVVRAFIDGVVSGRLQMREVSGLVLVFAAAGVTRYALSAAEAGFAESVAWRSTNRMREDVLDHALRLPMSFHHSANPGELVERVDGDISLLSNLFSRFVITIVGELLIVTGVVVAMFTVDWRVGLTFVSCLTLALLGIRRIAAVGRVAYRAYREAVASFMGYLEERLTGAEDLQALGSVSYVLTGLRTRHRVVLREDLRSALIGSSLVWASASSFTAVVTVLTLAVGGLRFGGGSMTVGTVYLIFAFTQQVQEPLIRLSHQLQDYQRALAGLARTREVLDTPAEPDAGTRELDDDAQDIEVDRVTFGYVPGHPVLHDVMISIPAGARVGVVGRTGSGKSTLAKLLAGLERPDTGHIRLGGVDLLDVQLTSLRDHVALVTQDVFLLDGTVRDNIALFDPHVEDDEIRQALARLGLLDWVDGFEAGLDTMISPHRVSAGEAQLVALARVLIRNPRVLVLDEASARLDPETERRLDAALEPVSEGRTAVIIAHRLATLDHVDLIMVVEDGRAAEFGARDKLAADPGSLFARMLEQAR